MSIAWRVADREDKALVNEMFSQAIEAYGPPKVVHADNGAAMTSNDLKNLLGDRGCADEPQPALRVERQSVLRIGVPDDEVPAELSRHLRLT
jgi:transposase InsO family protein